MVFFDQRVKVALKLMIFVIFFVCSLSRSAALCTLAHITARASEPKMGGGGWVIFFHPFFLLQILCMHLKGADIYIVQLNKTCVVWLPVQ